MPIYFSGEVIPPQSTLKFDVELLEILDGPGDDGPQGGPGDSGDIFTEIDADKDHQLSQDEVGICRCHELEKFTLLPLLLRDYGTPSFIKIFYAAVSFIMCSDNAHIVLLVVIMYKLRSLCM